MQIESIPVWFSDAWNITLESAQAILSIVVIVSVLLPVMFLSRNRSGFFIEILLFLLTESVLVGIGWLPFWLLIGTVAMMAFGVAALGTNAITGRG